MNLVRIDNLNEVQEILFNIFKKFTDYLDANHIRYFLCGGTLLGAINYKNFIPWDDDIDIYILREDYDNLISKCKLNKDFIIDKDYIIGYPGKKKYIYPFIKIFDTKYPAEDPALIRNDNYFAYIDVFPIDRLPSDANKRRKIVNLEKKLRYLLYSRKFKRELTKSSSIYWLMKNILLFLLGGEHNVSLLIDYIGRYTNKKNINSDIVGNITWAESENEYTTIDDIKNMIKLDFGRYKFTSFNNPESYLTNHYGDFKRFIPENERVSHSLDVYKIVN